MNCGYTDSDPRTRVHERVLVRMNRPALPPPAGAVAAIGIGAVGWEMGV